jgi:hypothetical protein
MAPSDHHSITALFIAMPGARVKRKKRRKMRSFAAGIRKSPDIRHIALAGPCSGISEKNSPRQIRTCLGRHFEQSSVS